MQISVSAAKRKLLGGTLSLTETRWAKNQEAGNGKIRKFCRQSGVACSSNFVDRKVGAHGFVVTSTSTF